MIYQNVHIYLHPEASSHYYGSNSHGILIPQPAFSSVVGKPSYFSNVSKYRFEFYVREDDGIYQ
jgi:hypothetical protein